MTVCDAAAVTKHSSATVVEWWTNSRRVCSGVLEIIPKYEGTVHDPVQVDELYFSGKRMYKKGRLMSGNKKVREDNDVIEDGYDNACEWSDDQCEDDEDNDYGQHKRDWRWALGIYHYSKYVRYKRVRNRKAETLLKVIKLYVKEGSLL